MVSIRVIRRLNQVINTTGDKAINGFVDEWGKRF